ncbi:hypothetical protein BBO99_00003174 [Phytophthora kernoviae]|uniref:TRP C-terminal domain-containing protein n=2 Tax=Phytophthora kernoviae TaxID=325452 RepID=A0A3R7H1N3_9STRA|nr:hypothetical protein G195_002603 [Phytophthora kernoviae 00238/432]KAG2532409.1 hypothetical protein JM16_000336 [Phytophthora kernoviae]KAG2533456.1 hypothetical protein JM18_000252 [Phytophthora kernoviae]RLN05714.1 hypothetical protein BBI17_003277 [Phytophthora kernoviae]RLN82065.1 hypothetical protein BBO99_00003174 [Phytophthora kernoviae]
MGLPRYADKFRGCMAPTQAYGLLVPIGFLVAFALFSTYLPPWGKNQIRQALDLSADVDIGNLNASYIAENSCSGCVFGSNTQWPTNTTGTLNFLDSKAGTTASGVIATSLVGAAVIGTGTMLWASAMPSAAAALSFSGGFYEMTHIVEQAQFVGMISQLRIEGAPTFLLQFSKELSWTNFNLIKSSGGSSSGSGGDDRRLADSSSSGTGVVSAADESGPARYATLIGVDDDNLFFYTLITFIVVLAVIHVVYIILVLITGILAKNESLSGVARMWYRKVMWASVLALLLAQYVFSMAGSYLISSGSAGGSTPRYVLGSAALTAAILFALGLGIVVVGNNKGELKDVGTCEHDQRAFSSKYSVYYGEYNFDNRFFFVPRILLAVLTGAIVGVVHNATTQLKCILGITLVYLILLLIRQPNLLRLRLYIDSVSVFVKVVLISLLLIVARDDSFPQTVRDNVAYGIIAVSDFSHHFSKKKHNLKVDDLHDNADDDVEEDFVAEPPVPAPVRQQFAPGPSTARPQFNPGGTLQFTPGDSASSTNTGMEHSYCNFADSGISTTSTSMNFSDSGISTSTYDFSDSAITTGSEIMGQSTVMTDNTFSAAMEAIPSNRMAYNGDFGNNSHRKMSISSNDSGSFNGDSSHWFKQRSKTVVSDNSEAYETEDAGYDGPTIASAFSRRQSADSYGYQSTVNYPSSHMDFNGESQVSHNQLDQTLRLKPSFDGYASAISMGADSFDGEYDPSQRRGTGSSNQSFISASSDGSADTLTDNDKSDRLPKGDMYSHYNNFTL